MISISLLSTFLFLAVTFLHLRIMAYMFHNLYVMQELPQSIGAFCTVRKLPTNKLLTQGYCKPRLIKTVKKFYGRHHAIVDKYWCFCVQNDLGHFRDPIVSSLVFLYLFCNIHVPLDSTEPVGDKSSGAPGLQLPTGSSRVTRGGHINVTRIDAYGIPLRYC